MTFYLPFDENVYRNQMKANFDLVFGNSIKTNKQSIYLMLPLFLFGLFTWIKTTESELGLILACISGCVLCIAIGVQSTYEKKRKEYWKLVDAEAKAYKEIDIPALIGFHEELVHYKDHKLDLKFSWSAFAEMVVIEGILVLRINAHNMIFFSQEEVGKDAFTSVVARCEANIRAVN